VLGLDPQAEPVAVRARVGYLPGELNLEDNLTGRRVLRYFSALRGRKLESADVNALAERLRLDLDQPIKNLSKGNKQKIGLMQAFLHNPDLLLLDEPTSGLDPIVQQEVQGLIREAKTEGAAVFFSSHVMSEVEAVAERVGIIRAGRLVDFADTASLIDRAVHNVKVRFQTSVAADALAGVPGVTVLDRVDSENMTLQVEGEMDGLIKALAAFQVARIETTRASLEDVFLAYYMTEEIATEED
jgi:ABC-2 type transport system ATP-binding protein